jgi:DNA-binding LacI/PurR family transcriptional regulator
MDLPTISVFISREFTTELGPKRLGLVRELLPQPGTIAFVVNPNITTTPFQVTEMQAAARSVGQPLLVVNAGTEEQVDRAFASMAERNIAGILYGADAFFQVVSDRLVALAARYRIPALYEWREFVTVPRAVRTRIDETAIIDFYRDFQARAAQAYIRTELNPRASCLRRIVSEAEKCTNQDSPSLL